MLADSNRILQQIEIEWREWRRLEWKVDLDHHPMWTKKDK